MEKMYTTKMYTNRLYTIGLISLIKVYTNKNGIPTKYLRIKCTQKICQQIEYLNI